MPKPTRIPVDEDSGNWLMVAVRFEYFEGECSLHVSNLDWAPDRYATMTCINTLDRVYCAEFEREGEMLNGRLTYSLRIPEERMADPQANLVIVVFTDRKVLGCAEFKIPDRRPLGGPNDPVSGVIDFVPARDKSEGERRKLD